ncbi:MAG: DUF2075 domain-containing protein [Opitutaceae bacterium]|nr:DUF2075 domain-containing protein [Opitutaceae bacterium]
MSDRAARDGWHIEPEQHQEWKASVSALQEQLSRKVQVLQSVLSEPCLEAFESIVLEYDLRRRGLRLDCILLGKGVVAVLEFKRGDILKAHIDQIENYCVNLVEFHAETRRLCEQSHVILVPIVVQTESGKRPKQPGQRGFMPRPWHHISRPAFVSSKSELAEALVESLGARRGTVSIEAAAWLNAPFAPSSTILDAALSLYGQHDVAAIHAHAAPTELIERCAQGVLSWIRQSTNDKINRVIFISGAPGSGKTLLGLKVVFDREHQKDTVFVTGNSPLVEVLQKALQKSYKRGQSRSGNLAGYPKESAKHVISNATFKIVKAHSFLGARGSGTGSMDGRIVVFDEAQRTYEKGRMVLRSKLDDHEAALILKSLETSYGKGCVVVALIGHNQFINSGEVGAGAWIHAASQRGWRCVVSDATLELVSDSERLALEQPNLREQIECGHLPHALRYYRNLGMEKWAAAVLDGNSVAAANEAKSMEPCDTIWLTRRLSDAKDWARKHRVGEERAGLIGSGRGVRLAAEGLFVSFKPSIADWMLCPDGDVRSSNTLETIQNQFQVQGLELDYTIVCWDLDLRREANAWTSYAFSGDRWLKRPRDLAIAMNGYRVLLTRARRGMIIFVPQGDLSGLDPTRESDRYNSIADYLLACGARAL